MQCTLILRSITHLRLLLVHTKVELILIPYCCFLPQQVDPVLLGVVVACTEDIVFVFLKDTQTGTMGELRTLFVVTSMKRVAERRHYGNSCRSRGTEYLNFEALQPKRQRSKNEGRRSDLHIGN